MLHKIIFAIVSLILASCSRDPGLPMELENVPRERWAEVASELPLERRLDMHKQIYSRNQHPRDISLILSFRDNPESTFDAIEQRSTNSGEFYTYVWILIDLDETNLIDLCSERYRARLLNMAEVSNVTSSELANIGLGSCEAPLRSN